MMTTTLLIDISEHSSAGKKARNQDACHYRIPAPHICHIKGAAFALADGISSSTVSQIASDEAVKQFVQEYYKTSDSWSASHCGNQVLQSINAHLYSLTQNSAFRYDLDKGYVCTFSAVIIKGNAAHIFHVGDSRVYLFRGNKSEILTDSHRIEASPRESYLARALGIEHPLKVDYHVIEISAGDVIGLMTDGVFEFTSAKTLNALVSDHQDNFNSLATDVVAHALENGSDDNVTAQFIRVNQLGPTSFQYDATLPVPANLKVGQSFDGYLIERVLYNSNRSHVYQARDEDTDERVVIKVPSIELRESDDYVNRLLLEEWVARKISSDHVISLPERTRPRRYTYCLSEFIEGRTLAQWVLDNPKPNIEKVRDIIEQVGNGLIAMHRADILHQDIRPENIIIEPSGKLKIIDLGAARVLGVSELSVEQEPAILGTAMYAAPEYFLGDLGNTNSDLYSLAVLTYYLLSQRFPYGTQVAKATTLAAQHKLKYQTVLAADREIPSWIDATLKRALHPNPDKRYQDISEFLYNLRHPNPAFLHNVRPPFIQRYPVEFWQWISFLLLISNLIFMALLF